VSLHITAEIKEMIVRELTTLPIESLVHVENKEVVEADMLLIDEISEGQVPAGGTAGDYGMGGLIAVVMKNYFIQELAGHQESHFLGILA
jgi:hypothetical protein